MQQIERLIEYFKTKGLKRYNKMEAFLGFGNGYVKSTISKTGNIGAENLKKIINLCPDLNIRWLLTGTGNMILNVVTTLEEDYADLQEMYDLVCEERDIWRRKYLELKNGKPYKIITDDKLSLAAEPEIEILKTKLHDSKKNADVDDAGH